MGRGRSHGEQLHLPMLSKTVVRQVVGIVGDVKQRGPAQPFTPSVYYYYSREHRAPKTVGNVLTVLNVVLRKAVEWNMLERMPCTIRPRGVRWGAGGPGTASSRASTAASATPASRRSALLSLLESTV
jgi:hypothetical protein